MLKNLSLATVILLATIQQIHGSTIITNDGDGKTPPQRYMVGYDITVGATSLTVSALGIWDDSATDIPEGAPADPASPDGLLENHQVGLWTFGGTLLGSVTVLADNSNSTLIGEFRYVNLSSPITLSAGITYTLGAEYYGGLGAEGASTAGPDLWHDLQTVGFTPATFSFAGYFSAIAARVDNAGTFTRPTLVGASGQAYIGPSALYAPVPEPSSALLLLCGIGAVRFMRRK